MRVGQTRRRDANEAAICQALRAVGATVIPISGAGAPDVFVVFRGQLYAAEIKSPTGTTTAAQRDRGAGRLWPIWRTVDDALTTIGAAPARDPDPARTRPRAVTHACDWDAPGRHTVRAYCGAYIRRRDHANAPTCPDCRCALAARDQADARDELERT